MNYRILKGIALGGYIGGASSYGFYRGVHAYDFQQNEYKILNNTYFYHEAILYGIIGSFMYISPIVFFKIPKEIYRLEVNLRNLEEEKKTREYNML